MKKSARTVFAGAAAAVVLLAGSGTALAGQPVSPSTEAATAAITGQVTAWDRSSGRMTIRDSSGGARAVDASQAAVAQDVAVGQNAKATGDMMGGVLRAQQVAKA
ncbi:hypothetical protein [Amycolatopsis sp. NPDC059657]|uniref:hypothetical protein n=1 Tax=Amycolatopsis sp. NPDC059657 TaxID=3346899 RepID=UPI00366CF5CB